MVAKNKIRYGISSCIGETTTGLPYPVFYDPHYPILLNSSPVTLVTGSPGSGKTFFGLTVASHAAAFGKVGFVFDPKKDFEALKKLERAGYIGHVNIWAVASSDGQILEENIGMLDPTSFTKDSNTNTALTIDVIKMLIGDLTSGQSSTLTPIVRDIVEGRNPSFLRVAQKLMSSRSEEIRALGYSLDTILQTELAKLIVTNKRVQKKPFVLNKGFVVANLEGLTLPPDTKSSKQYDVNEKISVIIMTLLCKLVIEMMNKMPAHIYKILLIDEAWAVVSNEAGRTMIQQVGRLGRSKNLATILLTQSGKHVRTEDNNDMETMISVRFAFRNNDLQDNIDTCNNMRLPKGEGWEDVIRTLETGECLMQDTNYQASIVHILAEDKWVEAFNTNPITSAD